MRKVVAERDAGAAELAVARAKASEDLAMIAHQKLRIAKLERQLYGPRSERSAQLIDQLALQFEELEASAVAFLRSARSIFSFFCRACPPTYRPSTPTTPDWLRFACSAPTASRSLCAPAPP